SRIYMIPLIMISWAIFALTDFSQMGLFFSRLFAFDMSGDWLYFLQNYGITFLLGILFATPALKKPFEKLDERCQWASLAIYAVLLVFSVAYLVDATYNPFLYFRF
ncbi:MAG: MBOAT family protein, partial [Oscillospiraceae bacterium]|nr:MBOAT family protein [Oscillospiraceae bacterium]